MANADRILVIDDDTVVCELVSALAMTMGLPCDIARDPARFLDDITPATSLILLDLMMPEMDGIEVLRLLGEQRVKARILLTSGMDKRVLETAEKLAHSLGLAVVERACQCGAAPARTDLARLSPRDVPACRRRHPLRRQHRLRFRPPPAAAGDSDPSLSCLGDA